MDFDSLSNSLSFSPSAGFILLPAGNAFQSTMLGRAAGALGLENINDSKQPSYQESPMLRSPRVETNIYVCV